MLTDFSCNYKKVLLFLKIRIQSMRKKILLVALLCSFLNNGFAQNPKIQSSNEIFEQIQKLNFLGTALYVAAHPDDENTRLISYLSNHKKAKTIYLSLTRGDGGQNLIGSEIRELLGVIRTQELLAARNVDGGEQRFTRANDFGYSKNPDETLQIWDKEKVLADVVWAIRTVKPDVIINRFDHRTPGTTHGHHTSSAMLSVAAFDLAAKDSVFSSQLEHTSTWQPKRLFFNTSWWFYGTREKYKMATEDNPNFISFDIGTYYPLKGVSNNEMASTASSQHLSQGFGRLNTRGSQLEYLEFLKGMPMQDSTATEINTDLFSGIDTSWNRVEGGSSIGNILNKIEENFNFKNPSEHLPKLILAYQLIKDLEDEHWKTIKIKQIETIIMACAGLYIEANANSYSANPNSTIDVNIELLNRSNTNIELTSIKSKTDDKVIFKGVTLENNKKLTFKEKISLQNQEYSTPYWLKDNWSIGMYTVENQQLIGQPTTPKTTQIDFNFVINFTPITITKTIIRKYAERDKGEIYEPFEVLPKATASITNKVIIFPDSIAKKVTVAVKAGENYINGKVRLNVPENWQVQPLERNFDISFKGDVQNVSFTIFPPKEETEGTIQPEVIIKGKSYSQELVEINYNHIPKQAVLLKSEAKVVRTDIKKAGKTIGYIKGAGDSVAENLQQIGYEVSYINVDEINAENLAKYDAIVTGVRAYNVVKELQYKQQFLLEYVNNGGNLIVQYNTSRNVNIAPPYPIKLSRDRVTDENAEVIIIDENQELLNFPNKITEKDFEGWVQERGLYFPKIWDENYTVLFSMNDKGELPKMGSLLVAKYGKGNYIYTGLSFFRELPAGVSGAYKLFANMLSVGKKE